MAGSPATDTLFEQALGLASPWYVYRVDFDKEQSHRRNRLAMCALTASYAGLTCLRLK